MFGHGEVQGGQETIIAQGVRVEGDLVSQGPIAIQGEVIGNVKTDADLEVGETAKIEANVSARNARVAGEIKGNMEVHERLDLAASARILGDITAQTLTIESGASVNGKIVVGEFGHVPAHGGHVPAHGGHVPAHGGKRTLETATEEEG
ncbi:MAG: polymer-forming cytoskeletal protein [Patescibacteria group bacterium]